MPYNIKTMDFTLRAYQKLLESLLNQGYNFQTFDNYIQNSQNIQKSKHNQNRINNNGRVARNIILRHDVDLLPQNSLQTALIEYQLGIKGTYYFRLVKESFHPNTIKKIANLGHEIGYHYEDMALAAALLKRNRKKEKNKKSGKGEMSGNSGNAGNSENGQNSGNTDNLEKPERPSSPDNFEKSDNSSKPENSVKYENSDKSNNSENPNNSLKSDNSATTGNPDKSKNSEKNGNSGKTGERGNPENYGKSENFQNAGNAQNSRNQKIPTSEIIDTAYEIFSHNLEMIRLYYPVITACMHGTPKSKYDSRDIWLKYNYKDLGIIGEPYFDINFNDVFYLTDTGRRWDGWKVSVRDKVRQQEQWTEQGLVFRSTGDIIRAANKGNLPDTIMITVHPQRWTNKFSPWLKELVWQNTKNVYKYFLVRF